MFLKLKKAALALAVPALLAAGGFSSFLPSAACAQVKLSAISNGGTINTATDQCVAVRSGTTDVLVTIGSLPNSALANSSMTLAGHSVALGGTQAFACADLSNGATGCSTTVGTAATVNTGTSGSTIPLNNGNNTTSGNDTYSGTSLFTGTIPTLANGNASVGASATLGGLFTGQGSTDDITFQNKSGATICTAPTGTTTLNCTGLQLGGVAVLTGNQSITLSSDVTGSGTTAITTTIANNAVTNAKAAQMVANTMKGNWTGSTANAADNAMPSCSDSGGNHLNYVSGTGITCGTTDSHVGTVTSVTGTAPVASSGGATPAISITGVAGQVLAGSSPAFTATPTLGVNASTTGQLLLASGAGSGASVTMQNRSATGAYNFNLPATVGGAGQVLTSQGGGTNDMTWASDNVGGGMFNYSDNGVTVTANTYYIPIGGGGIPQTTEASVDVPSPSATTVTNLQVGVSVAPGAGNSYTITLRDATADTALTCVISGASATTCSDLTHSVNVAQNDLIDWKFVSAGTIITNPTITISANNGTSNVGVTSVATDATLTGGTITTTGTLGINLANPNTWTEQQTFSDANEPVIYISNGAAEEAAYANGNSGTTFALNQDNGNLQTITISGAVAITLTTPTNPGKFTVVITQDGTGHIYSISGCKWPGGTAITYSTAASKVDIISIMYDGSNKYCMGGAAFS